MAKKKILQDKDGQIWPVTVADCVYLSDGSKNLKKYIDDGLAAKANTHSHNYLPLAGGTMTGDITFNKNNYSGKLFTILGSTEYGHAVNYSGSGLTILSSGEAGANLYTNMELDAGTEALHLAADTQIHFWTKCNTITEKIGAILDNSLYFYPYTAGTGAIGKTAAPWMGTYAKGHYLYNNNKSMGAFKLQTAGTADTQGESRLVLGNSTAKGTADNAYGRICLYGTGVGYTYLTPGNNGDSGVTLTLPASAGTLARTADNVASATKVHTTLGNTTKAYLLATATTPTATSTAVNTIADTGVYLTTTSGQLYVGGGITTTSIYPTTNGSYNIGSSSSRFKDIVGTNIYAYDSNEKHYASLRTTTVGTADTQGVGRLVAGNNTNAGTAGNAKGQILLYGTNTGYTTITPGYNSTSNITLTLPSAAGTIATTANIDTKVANYLPLAGGTMTGALTLNNAVVIRSKTAAAYTNTNDSSSVASGTNVDIFTYNNSGNLHIGSGLYDKYLNTGSTYMSSPNHIYLRTRNGGGHYFQINGSSVVHFTTDECAFAKSIYAKAGIKSGGNIYSDTALTDNLGTNAIPWNYVKGRYFQVFGAADAQYGLFRADTLGTTSTVGQTLLTLGNSTASGTANNAQGEINIYSSGTGYVKLKNRTSLSSNATVELPSASGQIPLMVTDDAGYWGLLPPSGSTTTWIRSGGSGFLPYDDSLGSSLGGSSYVWGNAYVKNYQLYGEKGKVYGNLRTQTVGTTSAVGQARLTLGNNVASGTASNAEGQILMYGSNTGYTAIKPGNNTTSNATLTLPSSGGTLARTADNVASATKLQTARNLTIGKTSKSFNGSADVSWSLKEIMQGQGLSYDTPCGTLYFNNGAASNVGRISAYANSNGNDYVNIGICSSTDGAIVNYFNLYTGSANINSGLKVAGGLTTAKGGLTLNSDHVDTYYCVDVHRLCNSATDSTSSTYYPVSNYEYSTGRFGCVNNYGGCAAMETRHNGATVSYLRVLPTKGIQLGSGKKFHIQASAPTQNVATGDVWIDV